MSIVGDLERARHLALASDETSAKELLLALMPRVEQDDRDDQMLEILAQLGELYLVRTAYDGVREALRRIEDCLAIYSSILDGTAGSDVVAQCSMSAADVRLVVCRYSRRAQHLGVGLSAALGEHETAAAQLVVLDGMSAGEWSGPAFTGLADEHARLCTLARVACATALCDDDLHVRSAALWRTVIDAVESGVRTGESIESDDHVFVTAAIGYARYCIETGRLDEAEPWLHRAGARAAARQWDLPVARTQLERGTVCWARGDQLTTERLVGEAYPVIAKYARAHDVSRCWLYFGLTRLGAGALQAADESWGHAERHWREVDKPLHVHRILLQRSWIAIVRGRYREAIEMVAQARACLDAWSRSSWVAYARLDDHLGTVWRADALADLGFDGAGHPDDDMSTVEERLRTSVGAMHADPGSPRFDAAMTKLARAADLKLPAALAVDSVRYSIADAEARSHWAECISAPLLAGAFAVAWDWGSVELTSELVEYHSARGAFDALDRPAEALEWSRVATAPAPTSDVDELALVAAGPAVDAEPSLTRLGPLPPLTMDPTGGPVLADYRRLAWERYGQHVTADEAAWATWP